MHLPLDGKQHRAVVDVAYKLRHIDARTSELTGGVDHVVGTENAFAAVKQDGSVVTWRQMQVVAATPTGQ